MNPIGCRLKNGLEFVFIPHKDVESVTIHFRGLAGSNYEKDNEIGVAHLTEHILTNNNQDLINSVGGKIVAVTSRDDVLYMVKILKKDAERGFEFLIDNMTNPLITIKDVIIKKELITQEIRRHNNNPEKLITRLAYKTLFSNSRMALLNTGSTEDVQKLSAGTIHKFIERNYHPRNFILTVSGNFEPDKILEIASRHFEKFGVTQKKFERNTVKVSQNNKFVIQNFLMPTTNQTHLKIDFYGYKLSDEKRYAAEYLGKILDFYIKNKIVNQYGYSYKCGCGSFSSGNYGIFGVTAAFDNKNLEKVLTEIKNIFDNVKTLVTRDLIEQVKNNLVAEFIFDFEKTSVRADFYSQMWLHNLNRPTHKQELENYKFVGREEILQVAHEIFSQRPKVTVISKESVEDVVRRRL
jgi:predicted Zn-dependent peptidase